MFTVGGKKLPDQQFLFAGTPLHAGWAIISQSWQASLLAKAIEKPAARAASAGFWPELSTSFRASTLMR
jgi:hypothetical protein